jgi:GNAT superfamily N-acetyltransferase
MTEGLRIEKLRREHPIDGFTCGSADLDRFLIRFALANQQANASQTYLALHGAEVIGFYTLVVGEVAYMDAPERLTKGLARHPIPLMLLARLAVSTAWQGHRIGAGLLKDAMLRTLQAADIAGIRAFAVHAKDDAASQFYEHFGFLASPTDPLHLYRLLKDIRQFLQGS